MPPLSEEDKNKVMHVALPILAGVEIMGTDSLESMGHHRVIGNNTTINLEPDTERKQKDYLNYCPTGPPKLHRWQNNFGVHFGVAA